MRIETALEDVRRILEADGVNSTNGIQADGSDATSQINLILERYLSSLESVYASSDAASGRLRPESALSSQRSMIVNPHHGSDHESVISDVLGSSLPCRYKWKLTGSEQRKIQVCMSRRVHMRTMQMNF